MTINPNIAHAHSIASNAYSTMAAERIRTWDGNANGHRTGRQSQIDPIAAAKRTTFTFADGSKIIIRQENCQAIDLTARK